MMLHFAHLLFGLIAARFKSRARLEAEILILRHQVGILRRQMPKRVMLGGLDRLLFVWIHRLFPSVVRSVTIIRPDTIVRWHRAGFRAYWRWRSRPRWGRPRAPLELRQLIREMSLDNPLWGAPRIHGELLKLGFNVGQTTVARYMAKRRRPPSQSWKTFLRNHAEGIAALDLFVVPTVELRMLFALVVVTIDRRLMVTVNVTTRPTAEWIARQITEAFPWEWAPKYLVRDRDGAYGHALKRRLQAMGIRDRPTAPRSPWQNCYAERVIGSIRRECLDHVVVFGEAHLRRMLRQYADYYNTARTHLSLAKDSPVSRPIQRVGSVTKRPLLGGLHHQYVRG
jgi:transposase InsO family protein